jgi:hypothetical protein
MSKYFKKDTTKGVIEPVKQNIIKGILDRREKEKKKLPKGLQMDTTTGEGANITKLAKGGRVRDKQPPKTKKYFRSTKSGAGMTKAGVARYRRENRRKSYCARSAGQMKKFPKAAADPNSRLRQARRRWKC